MAPVARARVAWLRRRGAAAIRHHLDGARDVCFIRLVGNRGDELIWAGTRTLLRDVPHREVFVGDIRGDVGGDLALVSGGGGWCTPFHGIAPYELPEIESRFRRVVVLPSSYDLSVPPVRAAIAASRAVFMAREPESYRQVAAHGRAEMAVDCSLHFDFSGYVRPGRGQLIAFRTDAESAYGAPLPRGNCDISLTSGDLTEWLRTIAAHEVVHTDRAHVLIAAVMLGKRVFWRPSSYHKLPGIADWSLRGLATRA